MEKSPTKDVILYLIKRLGGETAEGKKKIMKLMFLLEHYDFLKKKVVSSTQLGNKFYIYHYGVFSREVMNSVNELIEDGLIIEGFPLRTSQDIELTDNELKTRVDQVIDMFGKTPGYDLEVETLRMLGIGPGEKRNYFGKSIPDILSEKAA